MPRELKQISKEEYNNEIVKRIAWEATAPIPSSREEWDMRDYENTVFISNLLTWYKIYTVNNRKRMSIDIIVDIIAKLLLE